MDRWREDVRRAEGRDGFCATRDTDTYRYLGQTPGRLMCVITPASFEGFFEEIGALSPQQQQHIPRVMAIAKKFGLEFLPPPGVQL